MAPELQTIGRYQVQSLLGRGGMGAVYLAMDPLLKRKVVIKVVHEGGAGFAHALERFQREAEISARLNHPNVITVHDVGQDPKVGPFIAMEFVEGASLAGLIQQRSLGPEAGLKVLVQAARALMAAAANGITHRDVKPENILVGKDGRVKLTDFGIARTGESKLTTVGGVFGTPSYIAPELLVDAEASPATDCYALAVSAFELLTGHLPFKGDSVASTLLRIVNEPPSVPDSVPAAPRAVFMRALAKRPDERFPDVFGFMAALIQAYPLSASVRTKLTTLLAGEDVSLTGVDMPAFGQSPGPATPLPSGAFPSVAPTDLRPPTPVPPREPAPPPPVVPAPPMPTRTVVQPPPAPDPVPYREPAAPQALPPFSGAMAPAPPAALAGDSPKESPKVLLAVVASAGGALMLLGGAYTLFRGVGLGTRELSVNTNPPGAMVRVDGRDLGPTPISKAKVATKAQRMELHLPGYESKELLLLPKDRELGLIDLAPRPEGAAPGEDPELEALRRKERELAAKIQKDADRLKQLKEREKPAAPQTAPAPSNPAPAPAPVAPPVHAPPAPAPSPVPTPALPPMQAAKPALDPGSASPPAVVRQIAPVYPARARSTRFEPTVAHRVRVRVFLDEAGRPLRVAVLEGVPGPYGFDEAATDAALKSSFAPAKQGGRPVAGSLEIVFVFQPLSR